MLREKLKWKSHESESIDVQHGGGTTRSSDEVSVMEMERRGRVVHCFETVQPEMGGYNGKSKVIQYKRLGRLREKGRKWLRRIRKGQHGPRFAHWAFLP